jgi:predicted permease
MKFFDALQFKLSTLFHRERLSADMDDELRSHIGLRADDLERSGLSRREAERRARLEFGGVAKFTEETKHAAGGTFVESVLGDLRYASRILRKSPGFTIAAVLTLALGIGANAVVFGVMNALVLKPLNVPQPKSLYAIEWGSENGGMESYPDYIDLRDRNTSFETLAGYNIEEVGVNAGGGDASEAWALTVTGNYFDALHIQPQLGRFFHAADEHGANSAPYIVLANGYWHAHFAADPSVVGRTIELNKHPYTIVGVAPRGFNGTMIMFTPDFFAPFVDQGQLFGGDPVNDRASRKMFELFGHLKPGVTPAAAAADLNSVGAYLQKTYPKIEPDPSFRLALPNLYGDFMGRPVRAFLACLMALAALILLAACANLGSLFAARATDRSRELALRMALGSSRARLLRQMFTEALLISLIGGALGVWGSVMLLGAMSTWQPIPRFPLSVAVNPDPFVYVVALLFTIASGLLFGAVPVRQVLRTDPYEIVKAGSARAAGRGFTVRDLLLGVQIALCALLVTSSLVALRGLVRSLHSDFGFEPHGALLVDTDLGMAGYHDDAVPAMQKRMIESAKAIPGVASVGLVDWAPLANGSWHDIDVFRDDATEFKPANALTSPVIYTVSPGYLQAAQTPLVAGRDFSWNDDDKAPRVAVINETFARREFGSASDALGKHFKKSDGSRIEVIGVAANGKYKNLIEDPQTAMFASLLQSPSSETAMVVRSDRDAHEVTDDLRGAIRNLDDGLPNEIRTWDETLDLALFPSRVATLALGVLGTMGALLSITGIFGLAAYSVAKRKKELGIRIALGAQRKEVLNAALGRAFKLLAVGSLAGLVLGILASRVLAYVVYQATPRDPLVLAGAVLAMLLVGLFATWIPARRALAVDPLLLMRED